LTLADGSHLRWDRLLLATGSSVRRLEVPGADLAHVHYLRTMAQSTNLRDRLADGGPVVIVGAGWIGLEVAAAARGHGCQVTVIEPKNTPLQGVVGEQVGQYFTDLHASHGVAFRFGDTVQRFVGEGEVAGLVTTSGVELSAETIVVGVGVLPNTQLAEQAGLKVDNGIVCNSMLRTSAPDVFAAGDVANWFNPTLAQRIRVDHWANARFGGAIAARAMLGEDVSYDMVPYFFSDQYDIGLEYAGHIPRGMSTELVLRGDPAANKFMAFWLAEGRVLAGMHVNMWDSIDEIQTLISDRIQVNTRLLADRHQPLKKVMS
jgi:3-phenylpropionate/trans-cinnamate dioxygenase ferredoxin reductase subunit